MPRKQKPFPILPASDFIRSLVRSRAYLDDYTAHAAALGEWEIADSTWDGRDEAAIQARVTLGRKDIDPQTLAEGASFLKRWPALRHPIPPHQATRDPEKFSRWLRNSVEVIPGPEARRPFLGSRWGIRILTESVPDYSDLRDGQFLHVKIDATRSKEEILADLSSMIDFYRHNYRGLPDRGARTAKPKKSKLDLPSRRWEVWDLYIGKGKKDIRKTAAILFPKEFNPRTACAEANAEAEKYIESKGGLKGPGRARGRELTIYEGMINAPATKERIAKWKKIEDEVRRIVKSCEAMIGLHRPVISGT